MIVPLLTRFDSTFSTNCVCVSTSAWVPLLLRKIINSGIARTIAIQSRYVRGGTLKSPLRLLFLLSVCLLSSDILCLDCVQHYHDPNMVAMLFSVTVNVAIGHLPTTNPNKFRVEKP